MKDVIPDLDEEQAALDTWEDVCNRDWKIPFPDKSKEKVWSVHMVE